MKIIYCPHCNHSFESDENKAFCPICGRVCESTVSKGTEFQKGMGEFFQKTTRENLSLFMNKIIGGILSLLMLILILTNDEVDGVLKVMILVLLALSVGVGRKLVFRLPAIPSVCIYFVVEVVLIYAFVLLWLSVSSDPWPIQYLFGYTHIGRFIFTCVLSLGPAILISKM